MNSDSFRLRCTTVLTAMSFLCLGGVAYAAFPPKGDDTTDSLGSYRIRVSAKWHALMTTCPPYNPLSPDQGGWDPVAGKLYSPELFDDATVIGRSGPFGHGDAPDAGTAVGDANTTVGDGDFTVVPAGFQGPAGIQEIHTEVYQLFMDDGGDAWVQAGTGNGLGLCPGEVESKQTTSDYPAESFFNIVMEAGIPSPCLAGFGGVVYNTKPLLVYADEIWSLPPTVVYIHGQTSAVPVYFKEDNPPLWQAGEYFGALILAGHGVGVEPGIYWEAEQAADEMPIPAVSEWGVVVLTLLVLAAGTIVIRRAQALRA